MPEPGSEQAQAYANAVENVKLAIKTAIAPAAPRAKIMTRFMWSPNDNAWAGLLKSPNDTVGSEKQVHAIQIYHVAIDEKEDEDTPIGCLDPVLPFGFDFFTKYDPGTEADNSEKRLIREVNLVKMTLAENLQLDVLGPDIDMSTFVKRHTGLRVPIVTMRQFGDVALQYGLGTFTVQMQSWYVR